MPTVVRVSRHRSHALPTLNDGRDRLWVDHTMDVRVVLRLAGVDALLLQFLRELLGELFRPVVEHVMQFDLSALRCATRPCLPLMSFRADDRAPPYCCPAMNFPTAAPAPVNPPYSALICASTFGDAADSACNCGNASGPA